MVVDFCDFTVSVLIVRGFAFAPVFKGQPLQHVVFLEVLMFLGTKNNENTAPLKPSAKYL